MNKTTFAVSVALSFLALGSSAALATTTITGTSVPPLVAPPAGIDDAFQILLNGNTPPVAGLPITLGAEAACIDPATIGGCSFSQDQFNLAGGVTITPKGAMANQIAVFYLPDGVTIDAIFALGCDGNDPNRSTSTGLCLPGHQPNFTVLTPNPANPFILGGLGSVGVSIGFTGTELVGTTAFDLTNYINVGGAGESQTYTARLVLTNVPEPMTVSLFGAGLIGAVAMRRRKQK